MIETLWLTAVIGMYQDAEKQQADKEYDKKQQVEKNYQDKEYPDKKHQDKEHADKKDGEWQEKHADKKDGEWQEKHGEGEHAEKWDKDKEYAEGHYEADAAGEGVTGAAREIFLAADEATRAVKRVKYDCVVEGTGCQAPRVNTVKAHVITMVNGEGDMSLAMAGMAFHVDGEEAHIIKTKGALTADGARKIDYDNEAVMTGPPNLAVLAPLNSAFFQEFSHPTPFSQDEINGRAAKVEGRSFIGDVLCEIVWIDYGAGANNTQARWYFGIEDHLPRRVERLRPMNGMAGAFVQTIYNLEVDVKIDESMFWLETPEGYSVQEIDASRFGD